MKQSHRIIRNSFLGIASEAVSGVLFFLTVIITARYLGASEYGKFSYILAFVGVFQLVADIGLTNVIVRELAREKQRYQQIFGAIVPLLWVLSTIVFAVIVLLSYFLSSSQDVMFATWVMGLAVLVTFHSVSYGSVCRAHEEMGFNAIGNITHKIVLIASVGGAISLHAGILGISLAYLLPNIYQMIFFKSVVKRRYGVYGWRIDWQYWKYLLAESFPIGMAMVFRRATLHVDTLLLAVMSTTTAVGLFNAAYKIIQIIEMIPFTLSIPLFPALSRYARESRDEMYALLTRAMRLFFIMSLPLFVWLQIMAPSIILVTFGDGYSEGLSTLRILLAAILFIFPTSLYLYVFSAMDKQKLYAAASALALACNVVIDIILIPYMGHEGAAIGTLVTEMIYFFSGAVFLRRLGFGMSYLEVSTRPVAAAVIAGGIMWWMTNGASVPLQLVASILFFVGYASLCMLLGAFQKDEIEFFKRLLSKKVAAD